MEYCCEEFLDLACGNRMWADKKLLGNDTEWHICCEFGCSRPEEYSLQIKHCPFCGKELGE
jgi:hypothetical protein